MRKTFFFILMIWCPLILAQEDQGKKMVEYSPDFEFNDGIFPNFESVKENNPIPAAVCYSKEVLNHGINFPLI